MKYVHAISHANYTGQLSHEVRMRVDWKRHFVYTAILLSLMAEKADLKVVLLGKEMSGKSFLLRRFLHGTYGVPELVSEVFYT